MPARVKAFPQAGGAHRRAPLRHPPEVAGGGDRPQQERDLTVFGAREAIQVSAVREAREIYRESVVLPVRTCEAGLPRLRALIDSWIEHLRARVFPGGCFSAATTVEYSHRDGPVAEAVRRLKRGWLDLLEAELALGGSPDPTTDASRIDAFLVAANTRRELFGDDAALVRATTWPSRSSTSAADPCPPPQATRIVQLSS